MNRSPRAQPNVYMECQGGYISRNNNATTMESSELDLPSRKLPMYRIMFSITNFLAHKGGQRILL